MLKALSFLFLLFFVFSCQSKKTTTENKSFKIDTLTYFDQSRNRKIPVAIYQPENEKSGNKIPIFFSHGYGMNHGDAYIKDYPYLLEALAKNGYFVVSIQHELKTDELLIRELPAKKFRMENWKQGSANIGYIINQIKAKYPKLKFDKLVLMGHSNGGDQSALFANQHPELLDKLIALDNRRMDLPRTSHPKIYSLRSNDHPADEDILPTEEEQKKFGIVIQNTNINHDRMDNDANEEERIYLISKILEYLNEK